MEQFNVLWIRGNTYNIVEALSEVCEFDYNTKTWVCYHDEKQTPWTNMLIKFLDNQKGVNYQILPEEQYKREIKAYNPVKEVQQIATNNYKKEIDFLMSYKGENEFFNSLKSQYQSRGKLSDKQWEALTRCMNRPAPENKPMDNPTYKNGSILRLRKFLADRLCENFKFKGRSIEVLETYRETEKAFYAKVKFTTTLTNYCCICGKTLSNPVSVLTGIGPECSGRGYGTIGDQKAALEEIKKYWDEKEMVIWIPKSGVQEEVK